MENFKIKVKKIAPDAVIPKFALVGDAGMDVHSIEDIVLHPGERVSCRTGIAMELPVGYVALVWDKSSLSHKAGVKILGGVFDSNYRGEYFIGLANLSKETFNINKGQKIAQVIFHKIETPTIEEVDELGESERGDKAFGSTGIF